MRSFILWWLLCSSQVFAGDEPVYSFLGAVDVKGREARMEARHSSGGYYQFVEATPEKIVETAFRKQLAPRRAKTKRYWGYVYCLDVPLPNDVYLSAVVPYDEKSKFQLLKDLSEALKLDIHLEKREFPCRRITTPTQPYPASWKDDADFISAKGRLSHLPIYCVLHRLAKNASPPTQYILDIEGDDLAKFRLPTLTNSMTPDEILNALEVPVDTQAMEFDCLVVRERESDRKSSISVEQGGADRPATDPESKSEDNENPEPESEVRPQ